MSLDKGKLQKLYSTLQQGGYTQSYDEFEKGFRLGDKVIRFSMVRVAN